MAELWLDNPKRRRRKRNMRKGAKRRRRTNITRGVKRRRRRNPIAANPRRRHRRRRNMYMANPPRRRRRRHNPPDVEQLIKDSIPVWGGFVGTEYGFKIAKKFVGDALPVSPVTNAGLMMAVAYGGYMILKDAMPRYAKPFALGGVVRAGYLFWQQSGLAANILPPVGEYADYMGDYDENELGAIYPDYAALSAGYTDMSGWEDPEPERLQARF